ncbi:MAG: DNA mismatch repair endonuclease MutL [Alloprevotella sp.]|nr:DNA mismatch repair endonuclease MutL [Alloprevotella sp.]
MSDIIRLLPDSVANQIAAGEVIQRPSSVVKELVENAIDAEASLVQVYIVDAGRTLIQVIDNGKGMSETDARLAFERHATSKIAAAADLFSLRTMGFRGEALASIAAVAQVELRTRTKEQELGISLQIEGSRVKAQEPVSCPVGANFAVRNLFFNVPARRKFLKSNQTELSNIVAEFERIALAHPALAFKLFNNDAILLDLPASNFRQRISNIFGRKLNNRLLPIEAETELATISGFVGSPEAARKKGAQQFFFTNGRFMRHPYFAKAVSSAFERLLPEGEQVPFFIRFDVPPERIDVNIHPTKTEIKFQDEQPLWQILLAAVREGLGRFSSIPSIDFDTANRPEMPVYTPETMARPPQIHINTDFNPFAAPAGGQKAGSARRTNAVGTSNSVSTLDIDAPSVGPVRQSSLNFDAEADSPKETNGPATAEYLQFLGRYIVATVSSGLMFVDQHRAHERVLYERYRQQISSSSGISQGLLFPQELTLQPSDAVRMGELLEVFRAVGFEMTEEAPGRYTIRGIPSGTEGLEPIALVQGILSEADAQEAIRQNITDRVARSLARRAAMPVGVSLSPTEMSYLMEQLFAGTTPGYTPDGLPVLAVLPAADIDNLFK